jgi:hypothetical protein
MSEHPENYYPCPKCGGRSARVIAHRSGLGIIADALISYFTTGDATPEDRRCYTCHHNWPQPVPDAFTRDELGYDPDRHDD